MPLNLIKDSKYVFNRAVNDVFLLEGGEHQYNAGHLGKSSVSIKLVPKVLDLINGSKLQLGYDMTFEIVSEQLYSAFEFEKLRNKLGYIYLPDIPLWIGTTVGGLIMFNIEVEIAPGETKGQVKISGSKFGAKLNDLIAARWDGAVFDPWAVPVTGSALQSPVTPKLFSYDYVLDNKNKWVEFIDPSNPSEGEDLYKFKVALLGNIGSGVSENIGSEDAMGQRTSPVTNLTVKVLSGTGGQTVDNEKYEVIYEQGFYYLHYMFGSPFIKYGDTIRISFNV